MVARLVRRRSREERLAVAMCLLSSSHDMGVNLRLILSVSIMKKISLSRVFVKSEGRETYWQRLVPTTNLPTQRMKVIENNMNTTFDQMRGRMGSAGRLRDQIERFVPVPFRKEHE